MRWAISLQTAIAVVLVWTAIAKAVGRSSPREILAAIGVPGWLSRVAAAVLGPTEATVGVALLAGAGFWAALAATLLATAFVGVLVVAKLAGVTKSCGCLGVLDSHQPPPHFVGIVRAASLGLACVVLLMVVTTMPGASVQFSAGWNTVISVLFGVGVAATYVGGFALIGQAWRTQQGS